jgi:hypothetical protein
MTKRCREAIIEHIAWKYVAWERRFPEVRQMTRNAALNLLCLSEPTVAQFFEMATDSDVDALGQRVSTILDGLMESEKMLGRSYGSH